MSEKNEHLFFDIPEDLESFRRLLREKQGFGKGLLYLIIFYLAREHASYRLSAKQVRKRFSPLQVNARASRSGTHPCIADVLAALKEHVTFTIEKEIANDKFPGGEGQNDVFRVNVTPGGESVEFPGSFMEPDFGRIRCLAFLTRAGMRYNFSLQKLYILVWLWRLWSRRAAGSHDFRVSVVLHNLRQEMEKISTRKDFKVKELLFSLAHMDKLIRIVSHGRKNCTVELLF